MHAEPEIWTIFRSTPPRSWARGSAWGSTGRGSTRSTWTRTSRPTSSTRSVAVSADLFKILCFRFRTKKNRDSVERDLLGPQDVMVWNETHLLELSAPQFSAVESVEKMQEKLHGQRFLMQMGPFCCRFVIAKPTFRRLKLSRLFIIIRNKINFVPFRRTPSPLSTRSWPERRWLSSFLSRTCKPSTVDRSAMHIV